MGRVVRRYGREPLGGLELYEPPYDPQDGMGLAYHPVVQQALVRIGWDEDFILAERHPVRDEPMRHQGNFPLMPLTFAVRHGLAVSVAVAIGGS